MVLARQPCSGSDLDHRSSGILLFIALYQMDVWRNYRVKAYFPKKTAAVAEVTARQFEWRIRYPAPGKILATASSARRHLHRERYSCSGGQPLSVSLRSDDVTALILCAGAAGEAGRGARFVIPIWFEVTDTGKYDMVCASCAAGAITR